MNAIKSRDNLPFINLSPFNVFCRDVERNTVGNYAIHKHLTIEILIENMKKMGTEQQQTEPHNMISILTS